MANEKLFNQRANNYQQGRPGYAPASIEMILKDILKPGDKIADMGSGTGIFSKEFIMRGFDVYCVEPNEEMRLQAEKLFERDSHFISVAASAENTGLPAGSVNLITAASAFHWFDMEAFYKECVRILIPDGQVCILSNGRSYKDPFTLRQHDICMKYCPGFTSLRHGLDASIPKFERFFKKEIHSFEFDFPLEYTKEKFVQRSLSSSYAPSPDDKRYEIYAGKLRKLMDEFAPDTDKIVVPNATVMYWGRVC